MSHQNGGDVVSNPARPITSTKVGSEINLNALNNVERYSLYLYLPKREKAWFDVYLIFVRNMNIIMRF